MSKEIINGKFVRRLIVRGVIYRRISPSGKSYIGQTIDEYKRNLSWNNLNIRYGGVKIENARRKYGPENFLYDVLFSYESDKINLVRNVLDIMEKYFIKKFNTIKGGNILLNPREQVYIVQLTEEYEFVKEWSSLMEPSRELGIDVSGICASCNGRKNVVGGFRWMYKEDYINGNYEKKSRFKQYVQLSPYGEFIKYWNSYREIKEVYGDKLTDSSLTACCKGRNRITAIGFRWMYREDYDNLSEIEKQSLINIPKRIVQLSLTGEFIGIWDNLSCIKEAFNSSNIAGKIREVCDGLRKTSKGFLWMWENDYNDVDIRNSRLSKKDKTYHKKYKIVQKSLGGDIVRIWNSAEEIKTVLKFDNNYILSVCKGKRESYKGFKWEYLTNDNNLEET